MNEEIHCNRLYNIYGASGGNYAGNVYDPDGIGPALNDMRGGNRQPLIEINENTNSKALQKTLENTNLKEGEPQALDLYNHKGQELVPAQKDPIHNDRRLYDGLRIRKLTPKECWRLMGFADEDFEKARKVNSDTQLYKQAGNSIVVDVLVAIFRNLLTSEYEEPKEQQMKWF